MATLNKSFTTGFVLTDEELRKIYRFMEQQVTQVVNDTTISLELKFANGVVTNRASIDDVLSEENGGERAIRELHILVKEKIQSSDNKSVSLKFSIEIDNPISYHISGDQKWVEDTGRELDNKLRKVKKVALNSFADPSLVPTGTVVTIFTIYFMRFLGRSLKSSDYIFAWGDGLDILHKKTSIINIVLVGVLLAYVVGVFEVLNSMFKGSNIRCCVLKEKIKNFEKMFLIGKIGL